MMGKLRHSKTSKILSYWVREKLVYLTLFSIILLGLYCRYLLISKDYSFIYDEGFDFIQAQNSVKNLISGRYLDIPVHPPLHYLFFHFWTKLSVLEKVLRIPFVIFGTISIYLFFLVGKEFFKSSLYGLIAAFLYAGSAFSVYYSSQVRITQTLAMMELLDLYFYLKAMRQKRLRNWLIFGVLTGVTIYLDYSTFWLLLIVNLHFLTMLVKEKWDGVKIRNWSMANFLIFLIFLPWLPIFLTNLPQAFEFTSYLGTPDFASVMRLITIFSTVGHKWMADHVLSTTELVIYLLPILFSFSLLGLTKTLIRSEDKGKRLFVFLFFLPILISFIVSQLPTKIFQDRNLAIAHVGIILLIVLVLKIAIERARGKIFKVTSFLAVGIFVMANFRSLVFFYNNALGEDWRGAAFYLMDNLKDGDILVAREGRNDWPMLYYLQYRHSYPMKKKNIRALDFEFEGQKKEMFGLSGRNKKYWLFGMFSEIEHDIQRLGNEGDFWKRFVNTSSDYGLEKAAFKLLRKEDRWGVVLYEGVYQKELKNY